MSERIWFTADPHFGADSEEIILREMRPFGNIAEYTSEQVSIWNGQASREDLIYVLGDFCNYNAHEKDYESGLAVSRRIEARVILLTGNSEERVIQNHFAGDFDRFRDYCLSRFRFEDVKRNAYVTICGRKFFLTHQPVNHDPECLNLYGHTHRATGLWRPYGFNVCTDLNHFRLFSEENIRYLLEQKEEYWDQDPDSNCF